MGDDKITSIVELKKAVEEARLNWFNHNISYANGIACALSKIEKFEASVKERVNFYKELGDLPAHVELIEELRRILGGGT